MTTLEIREKYQTIIKENTALSERLKRRMHLFGTVRLLLVVGLVALWIMFSGTDRMFLATVSALFIIPFIVLMIRHSRLSERKHYADALRLLCENEMKGLDYDFSGMSHGAVLYTLKDALARFNIDTDHVYLSGHGIGGTAAWDIGAAHPDLWAGVIPIGAVAGKYINIYAENMRKLPFYYVGGELEGVNMTSALKRNAPVFNKYLVPTSNPFEATVVLYRGRGSESFSDELLRLFDWMKRHTRDPVPKEFNVRSMRHWDDFFWQVELGDMSKDRKLAPCVIDPIYWPEKDSGINTPKNVVRVESKILPAVNAVRVKIAPGTDPVGGNPGVVVFLTPEMIDFEAKAEITVNDRPYHPVNGFVEPNIETILEDARTRCDRLHPFWVRLLKRGRE